MSPKLQKVVERARRDPRARFNSLAHLLDEDALNRAFGRIRSDAATGVDGATKDEYGHHLEQNLRDLHERMRTGHYRHQAIRRVHIPKGLGSTKTRPIGVSTIEDKIVQGALREVLEAVFEPVFLPCSYGFRPGRGAHDALRDLHRTLLSERVRWILEIDIQAFFDSLDRATLRAMLEVRVADGSLMRLIGKCLHVGVLDGEEFSTPKEGTVQGSIISPLLGNVYLHYVLDLWFERKVRPKLRGKARLFRYADDAVLTFSRKDDAERVLSALRERLADFGLTLHPDKTRLVPFEAPWRERREPDVPPPGTFDFLGFTVYWRRTRRGTWVPAMKTRKASLRKAVTAFSDWCRRHRHRPLEEQHAALSRRLRGHYQYFGVNGNFRCMVQLLYQVRRIWHKWLRRRGQRSPIGWGRFRAYLERFPLPAPRVYVTIWAKAP
jgi:RNA-directed DNA polymerase